MHWLLLLLAIGSEIVATSALKETQGFTRLLPSLLCIGGYALAFYLLSEVVKYVPVGIAYALWSGIGVVIVSLVGWFFFHQKLDLPAMIGLASSLPEWRSCIFFPKAWNCDEEGGRRHPAALSFQGDALFPGIPALVKLVGIRQLFPLFRSSGHM